MQHDVEVQRVVAGLARETGAPVAMVAELYEHVRAELAATARVVTFLHVFAARQVRETLRQQMAAATVRAGQASARWIIPATQ